MNKEKDDVNFDDDSVVSFAQKSAQILLFLLLGLGIMTLVVLLYVVMLIAFPVFLVCMILEHLTLREIVDCTYDTYVGFPLDVAHTIGINCLDFIIQHMVS